MAVVIKKKGQEILVFIFKPHLVKASRASVKKITVLTAKSMIQNSIGEKFLPKYKIKLKKEISKVLIINNFSIVSSRT